LRRFNDAQTLCNKVRFAPLHLRGRFILRMTSLGPDQIASGEDYLTRANAELLPERVPE